MEDNIIDFSQFAGRQDEEPEPEEEDGIVVLTDDDGNEVGFQFLDYVEHKGKEFVVLMPLDQEDAEEGEVVVMQVRAIDEEMEEYFPVEDENLADEVFDIFMSRLLDGEDPVE